MDLNDFFFENALDASRRVHDLEQFRDYLDGFLKGEEVFFRDEAHPDLAREFEPLFSATFPPILHSSLVILSVMLVELEMRAVASALKQHLGLPLAMSDLQGSLLDRFRKFTAALAGFDWQACDDIWIEISGVFEVRN